MLVFSVNSRILVFCCRAGVGRWSAERRRSARGIWLEATMRLMLIVVTKSFRPGPSGSGIIIDPCKLSAWGRCPRLANVYESPRCPPDHRLRAWSDTQRAGRERRGHSRGHYPARDAERPASQSAVATGLADRRGRDELPRRLHISLGQVSGNARAAEMFRVDHAGAAKWAARIAR